MMNRIILHHSGGPGQPTAADRAHYHRIVDAGGTVHDGDHPISANAPGRPLRAGRYAAHTRGLNTGAIGLSMACMAGASWGDPKGSTTAFPTDAQVKAMVREAARLARVYAIPVTGELVLTHAEVQRILGVPQRQKWDFDYDPLGISTSRDPIAIGDQLRAMIRSQMDDAAAGGRPISTPPRSARPVLRRGARGPAVAELQRALRIAEDEAFGPGTETALIAFQRRRQLRPDGVAGAMTWAALFPPA